MDFGAILAQFHKKFDVNSLFKLVLYIYIYIYIIYSLLHFVNIATGIPKQYFQLGHTRYFSLNHSQNILIFISV